MRCPSTGFTLAELLIVIAITGMDVQARLSGRISSLLYRPMVLSINALSCAVSAPPLLPAIP